MFNRQWSVTLPIHGIQYGPRSVFTYYNRTNPLSTVYSYSPSKDVFGRTVDWAMRTITITKCFGIWLIDWWMFIASLNSIWREQTLYINLHSYKMVFVVFPLITHHWRERRKTGWFGIRIMCLSGATCPSVDCCFCELTKCVGLVERGHHYHPIHCDLFSSSHGWNIAHNHSVHSANH